MEAKKKPSAKQVKLIVMPAISGMQAAESLATDIASSLKHKAIDVDIGNVERITTPCIQLLVALGNHAATHGINLTLLKPNNVFTQACQDLGIDWQTCEHSPAR